MNMNDKIKAFLKEVNRYSKFVKVVRHTNNTPSCIGFKDYGREINSEKVFVIDEMGGDGEYVVCLTLIKE